MCTTSTLGSILCVCSTHFWVPHKTCWDSSTHFGIHPHFLGDSKLMLECRCTAYPSSLPFPPTSAELKLYVKSSPDSRLPKVSWAKDRHGKSEKRDGWMMKMLRRIGTGKRRGGRGRFGSGNWRGSGSARARARSSALLPELPLTEERLGQMARRRLSCMDGSTRLDIFWADRWAACRLIIQHDKMCDDTNTTFHSDEAMQCNAMQVFHVGLNYLLIRF